MPIYFDLKKYKQSKEFLGPKRAAIVLQKHHTDQDQSDLISNECMTSQEVIAQADAMIVELERVKKKAQSFFK